MARYEELKNVVEEQKSKKEEYEAILSKELEVMDSNPYVEDTEILIHELNRTNGLFKFVRLMREKFQAVALSGNVCEPASVLQESASVSSLAPASSFSFSMEGNSGPLLQQSEHSSSFLRLNDEVEKKNRLVVSKLATPLSNSRSPSTARRSSRLQERVHYR
ncbi:hypothetical protein EJ110_NYTH32363 [Nymphaea thermarum]|nr:hypothetical protein EJ110_NYTH32363 [Nymphaea thermarum]